MDVGAVAVRGAEKTETTVTDAYPADASSPGTETRPSHERGTSTCAGNVVCDERENDYEENAGPRRPDDAPSSTVKLETVSANVYYYTIVALRRYTFTQRGERARFRSFWARF